MAIHVSGGYLIGVPALANQQQQYLQWQLTAFAQGLWRNDINAPMRFIASQLTAEDGVSIIACPVDYAENMQLMDTLGQLTMAL